MNVSLDKTKHRQTDKEKSSTSFTVINICFAVVPIAQLLHNGGNHFARPSQVGIKVYHSRVLAFAAPFPYCGVVIFFFAVDLIVSVRYTRFYIGTKQKKAQMASR